jgi:carbonic anhydrase/acetyltransferase-like protein (isoleucine patch superfamily)
LPIFPHKGVLPQIHTDAIVHEEATVIGDVRISYGASVFPGAVIRGDMARITIGSYSNVQDNAVLHGGDRYDGDVLKGHFPVVVGEYVTIGHGAVVHGCKIENNAMIGTRAIVFDESVVGEGSIVGMGAVVQAKTIIPSRSIVVGIPARAAKKVDDVAYSRLKRHALWYYELAKSLQSRRLQT